MLIGSKADIEVCAYIISGHTFELRAVISMGNTYTIISISVCDFFLHEFLLLLFLFLKNSYLHEPVPGEHRAKKGVAHVKPLVNRIAGVFSKIWIIFKFALETISSKS